MSYFLAPDTGKEYKLYGDSKTDMNSALKNNINFILIKNQYNIGIARNFKGQVINNFVGLL